MTRISVAIAALLIAAPAAFAQTTTTTPATSPPAAAPSTASGAMKLTGLIGSNGHAEPQSFEVEMSRQRLSDLDLQPGQPVRLTSSRLRVFPLER